MHVDSKPCIRELVLECIVDSLIQGPLQQPKVQLSENSDLTKADVEKIVRQFLQKEIGQAVEKELTRALKSKTSEDTVLKITSQALARFFELMHTRKSTWQSQLKL